MTLARGLDLARPGEAAYTDATAVYNLSAPLRPAAAVTVHDVAQVRAAVGYAVAQGWPVQVHTTGHASATTRVVPEALLVRTALTGGVRVDPDRRVAWAPAGTRWGEVVRAAAGYGLAAPHGSSPTVGVVGYLLRGGVSFYGRTVGLAANSVTAVELVTADGRARRVDADSDPELFWALRGGGGGFGVVTGVEVRLYPVDGAVTGAAFWPARYAERVLARWHAWSLDAPPEAATSIRLFHIPPDPNVPPELTAGRLVCVAGTVLARPGDRATAGTRADALLAPLRAIAEPIMDTWHYAGPVDVLETHMDPADPVALLGDHMLLDRTDDRTLTELLRVAGPDSGSPLTVAELRQLGGALAVPDPAGGVLNHLAAQVAYMAAGLPEAGAGVDAIVDRCALVRRALGPWDTGRTAPTFVEDRHQPQGHLDPADLARVDRVRRRVDPTGVFRADVMPGTSALPD
ncbi:FAD-binding oxidoreductase [Micromonospora cathayae]|uniref:FAD-dependent oxidoreductase n=1 Tax=Micromonospora cathayae TaxID=3028804 RepID=A0ABY7ZNM5_9ACTN|nr:FAD-dependent oxidoreductase [Micromonospora sp. HUAS 3]WDZ83499.1 FAD-dependent oxidoreductase [Micromonospora sp. HUAS 3]